MPKTTYSHKYHAPRFNYHSPMKPKFVSPNDKIYSGLNDTKSSNSKAAHRTMPMNYYPYNMTYQMNSSPYYFPAPSYYYRPHQSMMYEPSKSGKCETKYLTNKDPVVSSSSTVPSSDSNITETSESTKSLKMPDENVSEKNVMTNDVDITLEEVLLDSNHSFDLNSMDSPLEEANIMLEFESCWIDPIPFNPNDSKESETETNKGKEMETKEKRIHLFTSKLDTIHNNIKDKINEEHPSIQKELTDVLTQWARNLIQNTQIHNEYDADNNETIHIGEV